MARCILTGFILSLFAGSSGAAGPYDLDCTDGVECRKIVAGMTSNNEPLKFDCHVARATRDGNSGWGCHIYESGENDAWCMAGVVKDKVEYKFFGAASPCGGCWCCQRQMQAVGANGNVVLLHGFPEWSTGFTPLMRALKKKDLSSIACNQRGYSPGASPDIVEEYTPDKLVGDVFALASAVGFDDFHIVGHDVGALVAWWVAASPTPPTGVHRVVSLSAMSIPHPDAFSAGLEGAHTDKDQQVASQYFTMAVRNDFLTAYNGFVGALMNLVAGFDSVAELQKAVWWYRNIFSEGYLATPPRMTHLELLGRWWDPTSARMAIFRAMFPVEKADAVGEPQKMPTGEISQRTLYICGERDQASFCNRPFAMKSEDYVAGGFEYLGVPCGHGLLGDKSWTYSLLALESPCGQHEQQKIIDGVVAHVLGKALPEPVTCKATWKWWGTRCSPEDKCHLTGPWYWRTCAPKERRLGESSSVRLSVVV